MSQNKFTTNNNPALVAVSNSDGETPVYLYADPSTHGLVVSATISSVGIATSAIQTDGTQKTQIVDAGGEAVTVTGGKLDVNATASLAGESLPISGATTAVGVAIVDSSGDQIDTFGGGVQYTDGDSVPAAFTGTAIVFDNNTGFVESVAPDRGLPVNIVDGSVGISGVLDTNLLTVGGAGITLDQKAMEDSLPVVIASDQTAIPVSGTVTANAGTNLNTSALALESGGNLATIAGKDFATQTTLAALNTKVTAVNTGAVVVSSSALPAGAATATLQTQPGVDIGDVTVNNASGAAAVNIQDGGNSITVDYATTGSGTATGALRVELPTNGTGVIATVGAVTAITNALPAGTNAIGKLAANSGVDIGDVDITSVIAGTGATNLGKAEDTAHTTGDTGVFALGVRNDTLADVTTTTADYSQVSTDLKGRVMTAGAPRSLKGNVQVALSNTTSETTIIAATASTFHDVYGIILANTGATTTKVSIRDDTGGTVRAIIEVPTLETRGFMLPVDSAMAQTATNKNWTAQCASATTALEVTAFYVSMV